MAHHIKFLKGYGVSINLKNNQVVLTNGKDIFTAQQEKESYYVTEIPYEKIVISGDGYVSTKAIKLLLENNIIVILTDTFGNLVTSVSSPMASPKATKYRIGQYHTFSDETKRILLQKLFMERKLARQIQFFKELDHVDLNDTVRCLGDFKDKLNEKKTHYDIHEIEAKSAHLYFESYAKLFDSSYGFVSRTSGSFLRSKKNATNLINALLNYGYSVLASDILKYINAFGLDAYFGFNHKTRDSFMALVYDIMEPYRVIVDSTVYTVANYTGSHTRIRKRDYTRTNTGLVVLSTGLINRFLKALQNTLNRKRPYRINRARRSEKRECMAQETTIIKEEIQNLADYCSGKEC